MNSAYPLDPPKHIESILPWVTTQVGETGEEKTEWPLTVCFYLFFALVLIGFLAKKSFTTQMWDILLLLGIAPLAIYIIRVWKIDAKQDPGDHLWLRHIVLPIVSVVLLGLIARWFHRVWRKKHDEHHYRTHHARSS